MVKNILVKKKYDKRGAWKTYLGSGIILNRAFKKYGKENFSKEIIEECETKDKLNEQEKYWISFYDAVGSENFYNIAYGGDGGNTLAGYSEEQMKEHSRKQSKARKGIINQGKDNPMSKQVICLNNMKIFDTTVEAAKYANTKDYLIQQCCKNKSAKTAGNDPITNDRLQWEYYYPDREYKFEPFKRSWENIKTKVKCKELNLVFDSIVEGANYIGKRPHTLWCHLHGYSKSCGKTPDGEKMHWNYV